MNKLSVLIGSLWLASTQAIARDFTSSNINQEFCKDIAKLSESVGVSMSHKSMKQCSLQDRGGAPATFERAYDGSVNVRVSSNPYCMFVTRGDNDVGTYHVLHPRKVMRKVKDWD